MIEKIVSGGQTGADQAALDFAIEHGIPHGGWIPKGRRTETGPLPDKYRLQEMPTDSYPKRTEQNVIDSDGTVIITHGVLSGGSLKTQVFAQKHNRPCLHIDLSVTSPEDSGNILAHWIITKDIKKLNVAGPRLSKDPSIYEKAKAVLVQAQGIHRDLHGNRPQVLACGGREKRRRF